MTVEEGKQLVYEAYQDAIESSVKPPIVITLIDPFVPVGSLLASMHITELLGILHAKVYDKDGMHQCEPSEWKPGEIVAQAWPIGILLNAFRMSGCSPTRSRDYEKAFGRVEPGHFCVLSVQRDAFRITYLPVAPGTGEKRQ